MTFKIYIVAIACLFVYMVQPEYASRDIAGMMPPGVFPDVEKLDENHELNTPLEVSDIEDFIVLSSYDGHLCNDHYHDDFSQLDNRNSKNVVSAKELAQEIYDLSNCFDIDAGIYAALIYKESQFCNFGGKISANIKPIKTSEPRLSYTNAVGLTMFTTIAWRDVRDQLYVDDKRYFHFRARPKLHNMMAKCQKAYKHSFTVSSDYYKYNIDKNDLLYNSHKISISELKLPEKWKEQLLYGAIKIKILLSKTKQPDDYDLNQNSVKHYYNMLRDYNGAGGTQEAEYWQFIFASYEQIFNPDFYSMAQQENLVYSKTKWTALSKKFIDNADSEKLKQNKIYQRLK